MLDSSASLYLPEVCVLRTHLGSRIAPIPCGFPILKCVPIPQTFLQPSSWVKLSVTSQVSVRQVPVLSSWFSHTPVTALAPLYYVVSGSACGPPPQT